MTQLQAKNYALTDYKVRQKRPIERVHGDEVKFMSQPPEPLWWSEVVDQVNTLINLPNDWDSYGAESVNRQNAVSSVYALKSILDFSATTPSVVPVCDGSIQYERHTRDFDLEIVFSVEEEPYLSFYKSDDDSEIRENLVDIERIKTFVEKVPSRSNPSL